MLEAEKMGRTRGERWVIKVGREAVNYSGIFPLVFVFFGVIDFMFLETLSLDGFFWLLMGLLWFERRQFYLIIQKQQDQIIQLRHNHIDQGVHNG